MVRRNRPGHIRWLVAARSLLVGPRRTTAPGNSLGGLVRWLVGHARYAVEIPWIASRCRGGELAVVERRWQAAVGPAAWFA